jgi:hypothetical protein
VQQSRAGGGREGESRDYPPVLKAASGLVGHVTPANAFSNDVDIHGYKSKVFIDNVMIISLCSFFLGYPNHAMQVIIRPKPSAHAKLAQYTLTTNQGNTQTRGHRTGAC